MLLIAGAALADTIYLKNGSIIKGRVSSYGEDQFVVVLNTGSDRNLSKAMIYVGDVSRIEFDSAPAAASDPSPAIGSQPSVEVPRTKTEGRDTSPPAVDPPRESDGGSATNTSPSPAETKVPKKSAGVRTTNIDVPAKRDWTSTGLIVKRGDSLRISAAGTVTLDPGTGQTAEPDGIDTSDPKKLMADKPTGALIAVIGADNDDFIFVGKSVEFTARRDGLLFLSVNEGTLSDNTGSYKATIELQVQPRATR
jgi:sRNA-binding regulator protein Hfq